MSDYIIMTGQWKNAQDSIFSLCVNKHTGKFVCPVDSTRIPCKRVIALSVWLLRTGKNNYLVESNFTQMEKRYPKLFINRKPNPSCLPPIQCTLIYLVQHFTSKPAPSNTATLIDHHNPVPSQDTPQVQLTRPYWRTSAIAHHDRGLGIHKLQFRRI